MHPAANASAWVIDLAYPSGSVLDWTNAKILVANLTPGSFDRSGDQLQDFKHWHAIVHEAKHYATPPCDERSEGIEGATGTRH